MSRIYGVNVVSAVGNRRGPDVDSTISRVASRQNGVASRAQLLSLGISGKALDHRVATGRLVVIYRGIYSVGHQALSPHGRIRAALLAAGSRAAASHGTAAFLDHLTPTLPAVLHVTAPRPAPRSRHGLVVHETTKPFQPKTIAGLQLTPTLRTLEDLGWPAALTGEALARRLIRPEDVPAGREAIPTQSELEKRMRRLCNQAGLPQPLCQHQLGPHRVDFAWPEHRLVVETDGFATHGTKRAFEDDRARDADLIARGWVVIRITWRQLKHEPLLVAARLAAALAHRAAT